MAEQCFNMLLLSQVKERKKVVSKMLLLTQAKAQDNTKMTY